MTDGRMRALVLALLASLTAAKPTVAAYLEKHMDGDSGCAACNLVAQRLDAEALGSKLVKSWKELTTAERVKELKKTLKTRACRGFESAEIGEAINSELMKTYEASKLHKLAPLEPALNRSRTCVCRSRRFLDLSTILPKLRPRQMETGPAVNAKVQGLCEVIVDERAATLVEMMETWRRAGKKRRLVDFRFVQHSRLCSGGVLSVCDKSNPNHQVLGEEAKKAADDDDDDDDDREL